jgi:hypothetical protein
MPTRVAAKIKQLNNQSFKIVDATDVEGLSTVATSGSYSDLTNKPNAGSSSLPVYLNNGTPQTINSLNINNIKTTFTLTENDFTQYDGSFYVCTSVDIPYQSQLTFELMDGTIYYSLPWIWWYDPNSNKYGFTGQQTINDVEQHFDCWYEYNNGPLLFTYKESWPQNWQLKISYTVNPDIHSQKIRLIDDDTTYKTTINPGTIILESQREYNKDFLQLTPTEIRTSFANIGGTVELSWGRIWIKNQDNNNPVIQIGDTTINEEQLKKLLALAENTNNIYMPVLGLVE